MYPNDNFIYNEENKRKSIVQLRKYRLDNNMTVGKIAKETNTNYMTMKRWLKGTSIPSEINTHKLFKFLQKESVKRLDSKSDNMLHYVTMSKLNEVQLLENYRLSKELTQFKVAGMFGITRNTYIRWCSGKTKPSKIHEYKIHQFLKKHGLLKAAGTGGE